ncbi:MAG: response regulator [Terriglobales bacterium]
MITDWYRAASIPVLPLVCGQPPMPPASAAEEARRRKDEVPQPRALVVDDEPIIADTVAHILHLSGFRAVPVYSGQAALDQAELECPDVVITDVVMPELNGIETAKRLLRSCPSTKILLLSGQAATAEMVKQARAEGLRCELLAKPLHPEDLLAHLHRLGF